MILVVLLVFIGCKEDPKTALPRLINDLSSQDKHARNSAALSLASYGEEARSAVPQLIKLLKDENGGVRTSAAYALRSIGDPKGIAAIDAYEK